jgi:hypothetical protein
MQDTRTVSSHVETVVKTSLSRLANKSFTQAVALPTIPAVVQHAVRHAVTDNLPHHADAILAANTTRPPVRPVDVPPPYLLSPVKAVPSIVAIASQPNAPPAAHAATNHVAMAATTMAVTATVTIMAVIAMAATVTIAVDVIATAVIAAITVTAGSPFQ